MKRILLSLIAFAGVWMTAGAQTEVKGYRYVTQTQPVELYRPALNHISNDKFVYSDDYGTFTLSGDKKVEYLGGDDKCLDLHKGTSFKYTWTSKSAYEIINISEFTIKTATFAGSDWGRAYVSINNENKVNIATASVKKESDNAYKTVKSSATFTDSNTGISIIYSSLLNSQYISYISYKYLVGYYTLDFDKLDELVSQATTLIANLSEKKGKNVETLNSAIADANTFKTKNENTVVAIGDQLRVDLTALENKLQAAIETFLCTLSCTLNENDDSYEAADNTVTSVTVVRKMKGNDMKGNDIWNTLCLPFDAKVPADWTVMELESVTYDSGTYDLKFQQVEKIEAGKPYIAKVGSDIDINMEDIPFEFPGGVTLAANTTRVVKTAANGGEVSFIGSYDKMIFPVNDPNNSYYIIQDNNFFYVADDKIGIKGFRGYFMIKGNDTTSGHAQTLSASFDDDATGITSVNVHEYENDNLYNIAGMRVNENAKGIVIKNGKKFFVK